MLDSLDAAAVHRWCATAVAGLRRHQQEINDLNVFPVADGDTGTNLLSTMACAQQALDGVGEAGGRAEPGTLLRRMARGALMGARGNSGVIISQVLKGCADSLAGLTEARGRVLAQALGRAAEAAYAAVARPVEGTVLTVATEAARAARAADTDDLPTVVREAAGAARAALARTPQQLDVLARAGVVDAGGRGLVVLLDALAEVVTGEAATGEAVTGTGVTAVTGGGVTAVTGHHDSRARPTAGAAYEVQYLLDADEAAMVGLRQRLGAIGESLAIVGSGDGDPPTWNVHVHVDDVGAAIEAGVVAGRPHRISVTPLASAPAAFDATARGLVVVSPGPGLAGIFAAEGAVVVDGGPANNPSTAAVLAAIRSTGAGLVALLPNDSDVQAVAVAAAREAREAGIQVEVVPTHSAVQALAALAVRDHEHERDFADDVIAMALAAGACRWAEVTWATREALTIAGRCRSGDVLALVEGEVNLIGADLAPTCTALLDRMLAGGGEMVTLVTGADAPPDLAATLREHLAQAWPFVEVAGFDGGQPVYPLLIGVE